MMIKNYLKIAFRNLLKNKAFTILNILGLSVGLAACLLIVFYVADELSYDSYNTKADRIYRITEQARLNGHEGTYAGSEEPLLNAIKDVFPEIEKTTRLIDINGLFKSPRKFYIRNGKNNIQEKNVVFTESSVFDVFTLPMIAGNSSASLDAPYSAVITETTAKKYFNSVDVVGQTLTVNDTCVFKITGVIKDIPAQSHFNYDFLLSFSSRPESHEHGWGYSGVHNYVLLKPGSDVKKIETEIGRISVKNSFSPSAWTSGGNYLRVLLKPVRDIHLRDSSLYTLSPGGNIQYVYIFSIIAVFILLIACVNFMNLSTARSANRAKEVGVRKVLGSARKSLIAQFLTESVLVTLASAIIAFFLAWTLMPLFNQLTDKQLGITSQNLAWLLPSLLTIVLVVGVIAGSYPAFFLSAFQPVDVLKGSISKGFKGSNLRSFLVVFQFSISIFLIIGTLVIYNQLYFIQNKNLGFDRNQVLVIKNTDVLGAGAGILNKELKQLPGVISTTMSSYQPTGDDRLKTGLFPEGDMDIKKDILTEFWTVDDDYIKTMGLKLISGRNFSKQLRTDSTAVIVNEAFARKFGEKDILTKRVNRFSRGKETFQIIGVVKDFNFESLRDNISPLALVYNRDNGAISVRTGTADLRMLMGQIQDKWKHLSPNQQFTYSFMDEDFDAAYRAEQRTGTIFICFSTLAIVIACLGLFGLAAYAAEQRNKEIGIRKVLGAGMVTIVSMLSIDFIKLVFISILIASPLAWWAMNKWLQDFAYRTNIQWYVLISGGIAALFIAFITISFQSVKAALINPVNSLRSE